MISVSAAAKSYHFGGSFPHGPTRTAATTDRLGRLAAWDNIHLVDASVFPNVPATTFTLTVMANAHRIASEAMRVAAMTLPIPTIGSMHHGAVIVAITGASGYLGSVLVAGLRIGRIRGPSSGPDPEPGEQRPFLRPRVGRNPDALRWCRRTRPLRI